MNALDFDTESGLKVASFTEIREALQNDLKRVFGNNLNLAPSTPDGMLVDVFAYAYNALAQNLQGIATNLNPATASGIFLDYLAQIGLNGRREGETDAELSKRIQSADRYGYATYSGMLSYLRANIGADTGLQVNESDAEIEGVKPNSFVVAVPENCTLTNDEIAAFIFNCKPAGIKANGAESGTVTKYGVSYNVAFSRITFVPIFLRIFVSEYDEEMLPPDYETAIKNAVIDWAATEYKTGKDVIIQRLYVPIYKVPGIQNIEILAMVDINEGWVSGNRIPMNGAKYAKVTFDNIQVIKK